MPTCHIDLQFAQSGSMSCHLSQSILFFSIFTLVRRLYSEWSHFCSNKIGGAERFSSFSSLIFVFCSSMRTLGLDSANPW